MYIRRKLHKKLLETFQGPQKKGLILAGVVGCGKTTLIHEALNHLSGQYQVFSFSGDDVRFRHSVNEDTAFIHKHIRSQTQGRALVFVDEVQKSEVIFDAIKYAFDHSETSFIISGSNPDYLNTVAKKRLQRRADFLLLEPFSLSELLAHRNYIYLENTDVFRDIILCDHLKFLEKKINMGISLTHWAQKQIKEIVEDYLMFGGLPLAHLAENRENKLSEIRKVVERGFESLSVDNEIVFDTIKIELAKLHSKEFAYQGIFQKTGIRRRDLINKVIDQLINQGYLIKKKPYLEDDKKRSYLSVFSYVDPGIVTYLTGITDVSKIKGSRIEGIVHAYLNSIMANEIPLKSSLFYYKPYTIDINDKVKFKEGEIDFIFKCGENICPIEVKATDRMNDIQVPELEKFVRDKKLPYGVVVYGGVPFWDKKNSKILYWPYWLI